MVIATQDPAGRRKSFKIHYYEVCPDAVDLNFVPRFPDTLVVHSQPAYRFWYHGTCWLHMGSRRGVKNWEECLAFYRSRLKGYSEFHSRDERGIPTTWLCSRNQQGVAPRPGDKRIIRVGIGYGAGGGTYHPSHPALLTIDVVVPDSQVEP